MRATLRLGIGIVALFAAGVIVVTVFANHQSWFLRAAKANAVRCMTETSCARIGAGAVVINAAAPPLADQSHCAEPENWEPAPGVQGLGKIVVMCRDDGNAWLYHMGKLRTETGGNEQWMACAEPSCTVETADLIKLM